MRKRSVPDQSSRWLCTFFVEFGDEVQFLCHQEVLMQRLGEIALVAFESCDQFGKVESMNLMPLQLHSWVCR